MNWIKSFLMSWVGMLLTGVAILFLAIWGYGQYGKWQSAKDAAWQTKYKASQDSTKFYKDSVDRGTVKVDTVKRVVYLPGRTIALANPNTPASTRKAYADCDSLIVAEEGVQAGLRGQVRGLESQVDLLNHKPGPPRLQAYGEALYDVLNQRPVFRVGGTGKLLGPISAVAVAEYAIPSAVKTASGDGLRLEAGVHIQF